MIRVHRQLERVGCLLREGNHRAKDPAVGNSIFLRKHDGNDRFRVVTGAAEGF